MVFKLVRSIKNSAAINARNRTVASVIVVEKLRFRHGISASGALERDHPLLVLTERSITQALKCVKIYPIQTSKWAQQSPRWKKQT